MKTGGLTVKAINPHENTTTLDMAATAQRPEALGWLEEDFIVINETRVLI